MNDNITGEGVLGIVTGSPAYKALEAENARLRSALEKIADIGEQMTSNRGVSYRDYELREIAREALRATENMALLKSNNSAPNGYETQESGLKATRAGTRGPGAVDAGSDEAGEKGEAVAHANCSYLGWPGSVCMKCGQVVPERGSGGGGDA